MTLAFVAIAAIAFKAWWNDEHSGRKTEQIETELRQLDSNQADLSRSMDSLRTATRLKLDSILQRIELQDPRVDASDSTTEKPATAEIEAKQAWEEAVRELPNDLTAYERKVAEQELRENVKKRFNLSKEQVDAVTKS